MQEKYRSVFSVSSRFRSGGDAGDPAGFHLQPETLLRSSVSQKEMENSRFSPSFERTDLQLRTLLPERENFSGLAGREVDSTLSSRHVAAHEIPFSRREHPVAADRHCPDVERESAAFAQKAFRSGVEVHGIGHRNACLVAPYPPDSAGTGRNRILIAARKARRFPDDAGTSPSHHLGIEVVKGQEIKEFSVRQFPQGREERRPGKAEPARMVFHSEPEQKLFPFPCGLLAAVELPFIFFARRGQNRREKFQPVEIFVGVRVVFPRLRQLEGIPVTLPEALPFPPAVCHPDTLGGVSLFCPLRRSHYMNS